MTPRLKGCKGYLWIALFMLFTTSLDARTKNVRLRLRLSREKPLRDIEEWNCIPPSMLPPRVLARMAQVRVAVSAHEQIGILQALMEEESGIICADGQPGETDTRTAHADGGLHSTFHGAGAALAFMGVLLERAHCQAPSGPLSLQVAGWLNALPDEAVAAAASFFVKWLVMQDPLRSSTGIGALCSLRSKQEVMKSVCLQTAVFKKCLQAIGRLAHHSQCLASLQALKALLDLGVTIRREESGEDRCPLPLEVLSEGKACLIRACSGTGCQLSHEGQIAAAQSLALIFLSSRLRAADEQWACELSCALEKVPPTARFALLKVILFRIPFQDLSDMDRGILWEAIMQRSLLAKSDTFADEQVRGGGSTCELSPKRALVARDVPKVLTEGLEAASQFLDCETRYLSGETEGKGFESGRVLHPLSRVKDAIFCVMAPAIGSSGVDDNKLLRLYKSALLQRDVCLAIAHGDGSLGEGREKEDTISGAFDGLYDSQLLDTAMAINPSFRVRYLLARPLVGSLFSYHSSEDGTVRTATTLGAPCGTVSSCKRAMARSSMLRATLWALTSSRALAKAAGPLLADLVTMEARGADGWWVQILEEALLDEELREDVANFGLDIICRSRHDAVDILLRHLFSRLNKAEAREAESGGGALECLWLRSCEQERVLWAVLRLIDAILREGDHQKDANVGAAVLRLDAFGSKIRRLASACVMKALVCCNPGLRLHAFKLTLQCDKLVCGALEESSLLSHAHVFARIVLATDLKGMPKGVATDFKEHLRAMLISVRILNRRARKTDGTDADERELQVVQKIGALVDSVLRPSMGAGVSRKEGVLCLLSIALDVWVPRAAQRVDSRIHSAACFSASCAPGQTGGRDARTAGEHALGSPFGSLSLAPWRWTCMCHLDVGRDDGGEERTKAIMAALCNWDIRKGLWNALIHNFEGLRSGAANVLVRLSRVLPGMGLSNQHVAEIIQVAEGLTTTSTRRQHAESGALMLQVVVLCLAPSVVCCPILRSDTKSIVRSDANMRPSAEKHEHTELGSQAVGLPVVEDRNVSVAALLLFSRTLNKMGNRGVHSRRPGAPPRLAYGLFLVLRKLLPFASLRNRSNDVCIHDASTEIDTSSHPRTLWGNEIRRSLCESRAALEVARLELNDMYICSGAMDDDDDDDVPEEEAAEAAVVAAAGCGELTTSSRQTQRSCWLTLKEGVWFLAELACVALASESPKKVQAPVAPQEHSFKGGEESSLLNNRCLLVHKSCILKGCEENSLLSFADLEEIGRAIVDVIFCSQHNGLVEQACGALHTLASTLLAFPNVSHCSPSPRLYHRALGQSLEGSKSAPEEAVCMPLIGQSWDESPPACVRELPRAWLRQLLERVSDSAVSIGRRSSQLSIAISSLLGADSGIALYVEALPRLLAAAAARARGAGEGQGEKTSGVGQEEKEEEEELTRVRAIMSLRHLLRDTRCGEKVIRLVGDEVLCCILSALQYHTWPVRNAANLALGAAVERAIGREAARALGAPDFFRNFPNFARVLADYLGASAAVLHDAMPPQTDHALMAVLALLCRLAPGRADCSGEAALPSGADTPSIDMWRACQELGDGHPDRDIREASLHASMCILSDCRFDLLASDMRSIVSDPPEVAADSDSLRLESICYRVLLFLGKVSSTRAADLAPADTDHGGGGGDNQARGGVNQLGAQETENHLQRVLGDDGTEKLCAGVAHAVAKVFATTDWNDMLTGGAVGRFSASAQRELLRVLKKLCCCSLPSISARRSLAKAADQVLTWLLRPRQQCSSDLTPVSGLPSLLHAAAGLCVRTSGVRPDSDASGREQESHHSQFQVRRGVCLELLARREVEIRLGALQVISQYLRSSAEQGREVALDLFLRLGREDDAECVREILSCLIAKPPSLILTESGDAHERSWLRLRALCRAPEPATRSMALVAIGGMCGSGLSSTLRVVSPFSKLCGSDGLEVRPAGAVAQALEHWMDALEKDCDAAGGVAARRAAAVALRASRLLSCRSPRPTMGNVCQAHEQHGVMVGIDDELLVRVLISAMRLLQDEDTVVSSAASGAITSSALPRTMLEGCRDPEREGRVSRQPVQAMYAPVALQMAAAELVRFLSAGTFVARVWDYIRALLDSWQSNVNSRRPVQYSHVFSCLDSDDKGQNETETSGGASQRAEVDYENESGLALAAITSQLQRASLIDQYSLLRTSSAGHEETVRRLQRWRALGHADRWRMLLDAVGAGEEWLAAADNEDGEGFRGHVLRCETIPNAD